MSIVAQYLFGSYARSDNNDSSDLDILSITDEVGFRSNQYKILNVTFHPKDRFLKNARNGDLFVMHVFLEGLKLYDSNGFDADFRRAFKARETYQHEIGMASDLGWFLVRNYRKFSTPSIVNRKVAWCVRTILIAKSAEKKIPVFSASALAATVKFSGVRSLIEIKDAKDSSDSLMGRFRKFLEKHGLTEPTDLQSHELPRAWWYFRNSENRVALSTIDSLISSVSKDIYGVDH